MSLLTLLCALLTACDPLPPVPVPAEQVAPPREEEPPTRALDTAPPEPMLGNRAPVILGIEVEPGNPRTTEDLEVRVEAEDPDRDMLRYDYRWFLNDRELTGQRLPSLSHNYFSKGDMLRLWVNVRDGEHTIEGSTPVILVRNTPPEIVNKPGSLRSVDGFQVKATDVDGDDLTFSLEGQPAGMSIGATTGLLSYSGSEDARAGDYQIAVVVEDPDGGSARWTFGITVSAGSAAEKPEQAPAEPADDRGRARRERGWTPEKAAEAAEAPEDDEG
jgi:hypothetical protein